MDSDEQRAQQLRTTMTEHLRKTGMITTEAVRAAFQAVPRHLFTPAGTPLEVAYDPDTAPPTKHDADGTIISSVSAPFLQAQMLEQAALRPGARVLEVGSGGYHAALLAEIIGPGGQVVTVDIDPDITTAAQQALTAAGYADRVEVVLADAEHGLADPHTPALATAGRYDAVIVTVGAWDIPPAWLDQLAPDGVLVVPLRMNGITRSIAFVRDEAHPDRRPSDGRHPDRDQLVSTSAEVCGFVPMQGAGAHPEQIITIPDPSGHHVRLRFDTGAPADPQPLHTALTAEQCERWSGVTIAHQTSFADLHLWFACYLPGFCRVAADDHTDLARERRQHRNWFPYAAVHGDSFALQLIRPTATGDEVEFGARGYGHHPAAPAEAMVEQIRAWHQQARYGPPPRFGYHPHGSDRAAPLPHITTPPHTALLPKRHGTVTITWPTPA